MGLIISFILLAVIGTLGKSANIKSSATLNRNYNWGVIFRVVGTITYMVYAYNFAGGSVDAFIYDNWASTFAEYFRQFDFSPFYNQQLWRNGQLFYTNFVAYPAAFFMILTNDSVFGVYLLFSLFCFLGLTFLLKSFQKNYMYLHAGKISLLLFLFPALWFWTSTIGKDSFVFFGIGIVCLGITNKNINYILVLLGLAITYAFRPPTAYITIIAFGSFFILNLKDSFIVRIIKISAGVVLLVFILNYLSALWGVEEFTNESLMELQQETLRNNEYGTAVLEEKSGGISSIPRGILDVIARPFIWEIKNILTFASALEINFVLILLWVRRKSVKYFLKRCLNDRLSTFVVAFVAIYVISVGLFENNIGLIARHRSILFPFLFLMAYAYDDRIFNYYKTLSLRKTLNEQKSSNIR